MPLAEVLKPVVAKANEPILIRNHQPFDTTQFDLLHDSIEAFACVVERGSDSFDPLVNFDLVFQAVSPKSFFLDGKVFFGDGEDTRTYAITNSCSEAINPRYCKYCSCV